MIYMAVKRVLDIVLSFFLLVILSPLLIFISLIITITSNGPVLYKGERSGRYNIPFFILKFRTMIIDADKIGGPSTAQNDPRVTKVGRLLRTTKIDELPQLINVLNGEMSLVGPRPQVLYYTKQYKGEEKLIFSMRPGITDLASLYFDDMDTILGVENVDQKYEKEIEPVKNKLRIKYVKEASLILDFRILIETFFTLFGIKNITGLIAEKT